MIMTVITLIIIGNFVAPKFVEKKIKDNPDLFASKKVARVWYTSLFYGVIVLIAAVIIVIAYFAGAFDFYGNNRKITSPFMSLLILLGFFLAFVLALFIVLTIVILLVRFIILALTGRLFNKKAKQKTEEPVIEIAKAEPAAEETVAEPVAEETVAEPIVEQAEQAETPVIINDITETSATVATATTVAAKTATRKSVQKSFAGKMAQATKEQKAYYDELKNYMLSFKRVNSRVSWNYDSFNVGRDQIVKIAFRGQTLVAFFALNPKDYKDTKYYPIDMGDKLKFADTPMMVKVKSQRGVKFAKELVAEVCKDLAPKKDFVAEKYSFPYMSNKKLIENGLAKEITVTVLNPKK